MVLSNKPPAGSGKVKGITKTERLLKHIESLGVDKFFNPVGIRSTALAKATGIEPDSISGLLAPHVASGRLVMCKVTVTGGRSQSEYRKGPGVAPPDFKPLNTRRAGIALSAPAHRGGTARAVPLSTPRIETIETPTLLKPQPAVGNNTGSTRSESSAILAEARAVTAVPATPKPAAGARLKEEPATPKASASDVFSITLDDTGVLTIANDETVIELQPEYAKRLGHFLVGSQGVWNPF